MGVFTNFGIGIGYSYLRILSSLDEICGARLLRSSDQGTSEIGTEGTKLEQSLTNWRFY